ncbi:MAG: hypothetical protein QOE28_1651 [Solirubrobacteraceae bacterium]|nr:hypothetical protein [Solirubrobacteraceae bacterium]
MLTHGATVETTRWQLLAGPYPSQHEAFDAAGAWVRARPDGMPLELIGDFVLPPLDGSASRDFQTLHIDFGVPITPAGPRDVAFYTALHVPLAVAASRAVTRLVDLRGLLAGREWPAADALVRRLEGYGAEHGAADTAHGYAEGSLARIVEAALGEIPRLPSVRADPTFLCGTEFARLADELAFFSDLGLPIEELEEEVRIDPGALLVFDNFAVAHGRRGVRQPGELRQWVFGRPAVSPAGQCALRDRTLAAFAA